MEKYFLEYTVFTRKEVEQNVFLLMFGERKNGLQAGWPLGVRLERKIGGFSHPWLRNVLKN